MTVWYLFMTIRVTHDDLTIPLLKLVLLLTTSIITWWRSHIAFSHSAPGYYVLLLLNGCLHGWPVLTCVVTNCYSFIPILMVVPDWPIDQYWWPYWFSYLLLLKPRRLLCYYWLLTVWLAWPWPLYWPIVIGILPCIIIILWLRYCIVGLDDEAYVVMVWPICWYCSDVLMGHCSIDDSTVIPSDDLFSIDRWWRNTVTVCGDLILFLLFSIEVVTDVFSIDIVLMTDLLQWLFVVMLFIVADTYYKRDSYIIVEDIIVILCDGSMMTVIHCYYILIIQLLLWRWLFNDIVRGRTIYCWWWW